MNVAFVTLFLGLVIGPQEVRVAAGSNVAVVEIRLDGDLAAELTAPAWKGSVDFGPDLLPHDIEAIAFSSGRREVGRAWIRVNMLRPKAQASFVLEPAGQTGRQIARLTWESSVAARPGTVRITLDGTPLEVEDPSRFEIPHGEPGRLRILRADLDFGKNIGATTEAFLGSHGRDYTSAELTAVAVVLTGRKELPPPEELQGWLGAGGSPLRVVAAEKGPADVIFLVSPDAEHHLEKILSRAIRLRLFFQTGARSMFRLSKDTFVYFSLPSPSPAEGTPYVSFPLFGPYSPSSGGLLSLYLDVRNQAPDRSATQLVRTAPLTGTAAVRHGRRRAVVWILDADRGRDVPNLRLGRRYLAALNVPLFVWRASPDGRPAPGLDGEFDASSPAALDGAISLLEKALDRQRIVWVEGNPLPQRIALTPKATGIELAR